MTSTAVVGRPFTSNELLDMSTTLNEVCGFGSHPDCRRLIERVVHLASAGEPITSLLVRLNPPARPGTPPTNPFEEPEPPPSQIPPPAEPRTTPPLTGTATWMDTHRITTCPCGTTFETPRRNTPGRYPSRCHECRR